MMSPEVGALIQEIEWYAARKKNLAKKVTSDGDEKTWGELLLEDCLELRRELNGINN